MKKEKMNDKGFSLVELIIVIAIMAVLVVVLAPQYLKYVEKSRNSTDASNATSIVTALQVWAADPDAGESFKADGTTKTTPFAKGDKFEIKVESTSGSFVAAGNVGTGNKAAQDALDEAAITLGTTKCKSKNNWTYYIIKGEVQANGSIAFTYESDNSNAFAAAMTK